MHREGLINSVCAIITVYNIGNDIHKSLDAVYNQVNEVILVDDGSDVETLSILKEYEYDEKIKVIYNKINLGISVAINKGLEYALKKKYIWVMTLDQDSIVLPNMVKCMLVTYDNVAECIKGRVMIVVPHYKERAFLDTNSFTCNANANTYDIINTEITSGNLVRLEVFEKVGKYNEKFFIDFVDIEFCLRIKKRGYLIIRANNSMMLHRIGNSENHKFLFTNCICTNHNFERRYYITRNRLYMWHRYFNVDYKWVLKDIKGFVGEIIKIILWEDKKSLKLRMIIIGIKDYRKNIYGKLK